MGLGRTLRVRVALTLAFVFLFSAIAPFVSAEASSGRTLAPHQRWGYGGSDPPRVSSVKPYGSSTDASESYTDLGSASILTASCRGARCELGPGTWMDHGATGTGAIYSPEGAVDTLIATIPVGSDPGTPTYDPANGNLYASNFGSGNVSVISGSTDTVIATVSVGTYPSAPAYDPANGTLYVSNSGLNNVSVISDSTDTVIDTVPVGQGPSTPAYDSANGDLYVANRYSNTVSVIFTTTPPSHLFLVAFTETGLPTNTSWSVTLNGTTRTSTSGTTTFYEPIGTYAYTVGSVTGYIANPASGTITVNGHPLSKAITFSATSGGPTISSLHLPPDGPSFCGATHAMAAARYL